MSTLFTALKNKRILLSDGAMGTQLQAKGLPTGECPESWNQSHPNVVREIARDYFAAGSDMVLTNTFGGNRTKLEKSKLGDKVETYNRKAVELAKSEALGRLVVASIGPTGEFMEPVGTATEKDMIEVFTQQVKALRDGGADGLLAETFTAIEEVRAVIIATRDNTDLPALATLTFDKGPKGFHTMMGVSVECAVDELQEAGAQVIGANCGNGIDNMIEIVKMMKPRSSVPILVHANAGMPQIVGGKTVFPETPEIMAGKLAGLLDAGATIVGGCCGTNPDHIRAFRAVIDKWLARAR